MLVVPVLVDYADAPLAGYGAAQGVFGALLLSARDSASSAGYADGDDGGLLAGAAAGGGLRWGGGCSGKFARNFIKLEIMPVNVSSEVSMHLCALYLTAYG